MNRKSVEKKEKQEKQEKKIRKKHLLVRVGLIVLLMFAVVTILNSGEIMISYLAMSLANTERNAQHIASHVRDEMGEYQALSWLLDYWQEHAEEIDAPCGALEDTEGTWYRDHADLCRIDVQSVTAEEIQAEAPERQDLFAEYCYAKIIEECDSVRAAFGMGGLYCVGRTSEDDLFVFFSVRDGKQPGDTYSLGNVIPKENVGNDEAYSLFDLPVQGQNETEDSKDGAAGLTLSSGRGSDGRESDEILIASPLYVDGSVRCLIGESLFSEESGDELMKGITKIGGRNLNYLIIVGILLVIFLYFQVIRPITSLQKSVRKYAESKSAEKAEKDLRKLCRSRNEVGFLARDVTSMIEEVDRYMEEIREATTEKERISTELDMAKNIQRSQLPNIFPPFPDRDEFDIYASMTPAKEVGGDFYDFFMVDSDHLALVIADVSGKGIPASLFMMVSKILIKNRIQGGESPGPALANVNAQLLEGGETDMFVTVWLAVLEISTGKGICANAGHEHPALKRKEGCYELVRYRHSPAVGTIEDIPFAEHTFMLAPGDRLFVYTDGVPEAADSADELFGTDRMLEALNQDPDAGPEKTIDNMYGAIREFVQGAEQFDDITMLALDYRGPSGQPQKEQ